MSRRLPTTSSSGVLERWRAFDATALLDQWRRDGEPAIPASVLARLAAPGRRRQRNRFLETEIRRAIRAARREGADKIEVDPSTGKITMTLAKPAESNDPNSWDEVLEDAPHPKRVA
jgi:hypothetical protein